MSGVCDAAQRGRRVNIFSRVFIPLGFLITAVSLIALNTVNAASSSFKVTDAAITAQSAGVDASIGSFDETKITSDVIFYHLNDSVTYRVELQNTGEDAVTISSISDNNASPYLTYNYSTHAGEEIAAGGTLPLEVEVVYSTAVAEITARSQSLEIEFTINCVEDDEIVVPSTGETLDSESAVAPDTGVATADSGAKVNFAPLIVAIVGAVLLAAGLYRSKLSNKTKNIALVLAGSLTIVSAVNASSKDFTFTFASDFEIKSILAVNYNNGTNDVAVVVPYGSTLEDELEEPQVEGYIFNGWLDENDEPFDLTQPVTDDVNIHPDLTPIQYTLYIDIDGDYSYSLEMKLKYDQEYQLPTLSRDKWQWGMKHDGWLDRGLDWGAEDDDKRYSAGQVVKGLSSTQDDEIWLETTWSGRTYAVVYQNVDDETFLSAAPTEVSYDEFEANAWKISLPGTPVKEGYQFGGWKFNGDGPYTVDYIIALLPEESDDFVVEATWEKKAMQVCYFSGAAPGDVTGESKCDTLDYDDTDYTVAHNYFTRTGYDPIDGWRYDSVDYTGGQSFDVRAFTNACARPDQNHCSLNLTARWTPRQTVMHFVPGADDATGEVEDAIFTYDQPASGGNSTYTRPGYTHSGWSCDYGSTYGTVTYALSGITTNAWKHDVPEVTCSAVWNKNWYWIVFDKNAQDATGGMYGMTVTYGDTTPLNQNQFVREGYRFIGWKRNNEGDLIADGASAGQFPVAANEETITLYAQWEEASSGNEYEAMQSMTTAKCAEMEIGTMVNLQDTRDNKVYRVGKLADNNCWMLDTLKIANVEISDEDSDLPEDTTFVLPDSNDDAFEEEPRNTPKLYIDPANNHSVFYNYYTATAGWGVYGNDNLAATTTDSPQSICPKGWKLPNGGNSYDGDFNNLVSVYGQDQTAYMGEFPGFELDGALSASNGKVTGPDDYGHRGYFWSSTNRSKWFANRFLIVDDVYSPEISGVSYDFNYYKYWENNIVCIAR